MVIVRLIKLPHTIRAFTAVDPDGNENVYINESLTATEQRKALRHEMRHISQGDTESETPVRILEAARHG